MTLQTDSARAKQLELHIQARVAEELERLRQREQQSLEEIERRVAEALPNRNVPSKPSPTAALPVGSLDLDAPRIPFAGREYDAPSFPIVSPTPAPPEPTYSQPTPTDVDPSRETVLKEIERLRGKLESRKKLADLDENVERARADVVRCLRLNDRRPLDCWKEVEQFKQEMAKMERSFVDRVVG